MCDECCIDDRRRCVTCTDPNALPSIWLHISNDSSTTHFSSSQLHQIYLISWNFISFHLPIKLDRLCYRAIACWPHWLYGAVVWSFYSMWSRVVGIALYHFAIQFQPSTRFVCLMCAFVLLYEIRNVWSFMWNHTMHDSSYTDTHKQKANARE